MEPIRSANLAALGGCPRAFGRNNMKTLLALTLIALVSGRANAVPDPNRLLLTAFPKAVLAQKDPKIFVVVDQSKPDAILKGLQKHTTEPLAFVDLNAANRAEFGFPQDFSKFEVAKFVTCGGRYCFLLTKSDKAAGYVFNLLPKNPPH